MVGLLSRHGLEVGAGVDVGLVVPVLGFIEMLAKDCSMFFRLGRAVDGSFSTSRDLALSWSCVILMSASTARR